MSIDRKFEGNPQYQPEKCGLRVVGEIGERDMSYEFNDAVLWQDVESGEYYFATDSGCSCPTPFEDYDSLSSLTHIPSRDVLRREVESWVNSMYSGKPDHGDIEAFIALVP